MSKGAKVGFACALGALVGSILGIELSAWLGLGKILACVIGFLSGGGIGWLAYDSGKVISAFRRAWSELRSRPKQDRQYWHTYLVSTGLSIFLALGGFLMLLVALVWIDYMKLGNTALSYGQFMILELSREGPFPLIVSLTLMCFLGYSWNSERLRGIFQDREERDPQTVATEARKLEKDRFRMFLLWNPIMAPFSFIGCVLYGIYWTFVRVPKIFSFLGNVIVLTYRFTHSELRATCFVDGGLGAVGGILLGSPFVGLMIGLALGLINYYVISPRLGIRHAKT